MLKNASKSIANFIGRQAGVRAELKSIELSIMPLSIKAQATLGFVKDTRAVARFLDGLRQARSPSRSDRRVEPGLDLECQKMNAVRHHWRKKKGSRRSNDSAVSDVLIGNLRRNQFRMQKHGSKKASLDELVIRVLWEYLSKGIEIRAWRSRVGVDLIADMEVLRHIQSKRRTSTGGC